MVGWHHRLNGYEFEQAPGDGEGQGSLECCSPWGHKESDMTEQQNNNNTGSQRTDPEAEALIFQPPDAKSQFMRKDPDAGKDGRQEEKGTTEHEMVRWHHRLNGYEFEQAPGDGERQGSLVCCSSRGHEESDVT